MLTDKKQVENGLRHHLLISGTGRAGTSFLVRYLAGMGLETHLELHGDNQWSDEANAGFEDLLSARSGTHLPYVIKSPWMCEIIDSVLANPSTCIDAVIIPVRDLAEAAASRVIIERQAIHSKAEFTELEFNENWESWGHTPGGMVFSLNPIDQGRLLAVWFYQLIERLTKANIPIVLLTFPQLAEDPDYLFNKVRDLLPKAATVEEGRKLHHTIADATKIRVGQELGATQGRRGESAIPSGIAYPNRADLDQIAIQREFIR
jgi:hypothetical protein